ncbi:right-handed parallel beta-helix repeat-containing protein [Haladaptatus sp. DYSN1]|uniref:right-handed parallel beta-helix repeat-containing protein n=1 Tax=unclassified Haladaptatus TaxID=2622732 RepID=UPI002405B949|nr:right-handed parallel beta-helix repeat-containing protein [Haladaptatus sp. DYSN1]
MERRSGETIGDNDKLFRRRDYLKVLGTSAAVVGGLGAASGTAAADYSTIKLSQNERRTLRVGSGETLENVLIDVSASGADLLIKAEGNDWTIRNVGIKGQFDVGEDGGYGYVFRFDGNGLIENVYLGDGFKWGISSKGAMLSGPEHSGHVTIRNCYVAGWSDNAIYAAGSGRVTGPGSTDGQGGNYTFENCYFRDNNISHLRLAADGTVVKGCVFHNTGNVRPEMNTSAGQSDVVNSRGIYTGYGDPSQVITVTDCDFNITGSNTCSTDNWDYSACGSSVAQSTDHSTYGACSTVRFENSRINGRTLGDYVEVASSTETGPDAPNIRVPAGVPQSPEEAADGSASSTDSSAPTTTSTVEEEPAPDEEEQQPADGSILSITGVNGQVTNYAFAVTGSLEKSDANDATIDPGDDLSGSSADGAVAGGTDSYVFDGEFTKFTLDGEATVTVDGSEVDPEDLVTAEPEQESSDDADIVSIVGDAGDVVNYELTASKDLVKSTANDATKDEGDDLSGNTASGAVAGGTDSYKVVGELVDVTLDGDATVLLNNEEIDPDDYGYDNVISISGGSASNIAEYEFAASGGIRKSEANGATIDSEDSISGQTATGAVAGGIDSYEFAGELTSFDGPAGLTVTVNGSPVDTRSL